jgi:hypothetical protein
VFNIVDNRHQLDSQKEGALGITIGSSDNNIKMDSREIECRGMDSIDAAQEMDCGRILL